MNATENLLKSQLEDSRSSAKLYKKTIMNMARASLSKIPREDLIEMLIKKKIIKKDWSQKGNKYTLRHNDKKRRIQNNE